MTGDPVTSRDGRVWEKVDLKPRAGGVIAVEVAGDRLTTDEISRDVRACPGFTWMPGMREQDGDRVFDLTEAGAPIWGGGDGHVGDPGTFPDMEDAMTVHAVILLSRVIHGDPSLHIRCTDDEGLVWWWTGEVTEAAAQDWWRSEAGAALSMLQGDGVPS